MKFKTDVEVSWTNDAGIHYGKGKIDWELDIIERDWGVSDILPVVKDQKVKVTYEDSETEEMLETEVQIKNAEVDLIGDPTSSGLGLMPIEVMVDKRGKASVQFEITAK